MLSRSSLVLLAAVAALAASAPIAAHSLVDRGRSPTAVPAVHRKHAAIWKREWVVCAAPMRSLARDPDVRLSAKILAYWLSVSPQFAAEKLAAKIELGDAGVGYTGSRLLAAVDGCRNGILYFYYH